MTKRKAFVVVLLALGAIAAIALHEWPLVAQVPASGTIAGFRLAGPVDSEIARDFLERQTLPAGLLRVRNDYAQTQRAPTRTELADLSQRYSPDVATLTFIEAVSRLPENVELRRRYERELAYVRAVGVDHAGRGVPDDLLVLFVPGWFYVSHGSETNADLQRQRRLLDRFGVRNELVRVDENGKVEDNAVTVANAIRAASAGHRLIVVSASKSGAEVALALGRELRPDETRSVAAWLSIGGVVRGTPFADRVLEPDLCWFVRAQLRLQGFDLEGARSMRTDRAGAAFRTLAFPQHIEIVSYVAAPLSGHISERGDFGYARMRSHGPNDGLTLLADEIIPGGSTLLAPGVDHFFDHPDQPLWTAALFRVLVDRAARFGEG